jgi:hypothetical protein
MRIFSKIVFICNVCFILAAVIRIIDMGLRKNGNGEALIPLPFVVATIALLGTVVSFLSNILFASILVAKKISKQIIDLPAYIIYFNLLMLPVEIWYFFIWKT